MTKAGGGLGGLLGLVDNPDESWRKFGKKDPYFGVLSAERFRKENLDEAARKADRERWQGHSSDIRAQLTLTTGYDAAG